MRWFAPSSDAAICMTGGTKEILEIFCVSQIRPDSIIVRPASCYGCQHMMVQHLYRPLHFIFGPLDYEQSPCFFGKVL